MAINNINTRIKLKYDTLQQWLDSSDSTKTNPVFIPLAGEVCIAVIPNGQESPREYDVGNPVSDQLSPYAIGIKVGDGTRTFAQLPWIQAIAGDVYSWAKASVKPTYQASEINGLSTFISEHDADTQYRIQVGTGNDAGKYFLQSKANGADDSTFSTVSTIDLSSVQNALEFDGTYDSSTNKVATESTVTDAIEALDGSITGTPGASKTLTDFSETDGVVTATFADIAINESQVTNLESDLAAKAPLASPGFSGTPTAPTATAGTNTTQIATTAFVKNAVETATAGLSSAMHYKGAVNDDPITTAPTGTFIAGDVVTYNISEYVYDGTNWRELGTEGSYALSTISVTGSGGLEGGGALNSDQTITHAVPNGATATTKGTAGGREYIQTITTDKFGHITAVTTATETVTDTTYTFAEGNTNGEFSVTPSGGSAQQVKIHGLGDAAFKGVSTSIPTSGATDDEKLPTVAAVKGIVNGLDSSLAAIAKTGSIYDVIEHDTVTENNASINFLIFDCGDASHLVTNPT